VLGILGTAASANLLAGRAERTRKQLREEAELLEHLPLDLPGRPQFVSQLSVNIWTYVDHQRDLVYRKLRTRYTAALIALMLVSTVGMAGMTWVLVRVEEVTNRHVWAAAGFAVVAAIIGLCAVLAGRRLRRHMLMTAPDPHALASVAQPSDAPRAAA
jgi:hypothetical protein